MGDRGIGARLQGFELVDVGPIRDLVERFTKENATAQAEWDAASDAASTARATFEELGLAVREEAGSPLPDGDAAQRQLAEKVTRLRHAVEVRVRAAEAVQELEASANAAVSDASDLLLGRRAVFVVAVLAGAWCVWGFFS